jgi:DNA integrity scanning protein DisA with diadenylate cyclase activity
MIIERQDRVEELITAGQPLDGDATPELLLSIFQKESPLHDGAVLIRDGRINQVACYLPLSPDEGLPKAWGTRHRAALGLSQRCDAWVVVVSEERGQVSVARGGEMVHAENHDAFVQLIVEALGPMARVTKTWHEKMRALLVTRWRTKLGTLAIVCLLWLLLAGQQDFEVSFRVPLESKNLPANMVILDPLGQKIQVTVRGLRKDASTINEEDVKAELDLSLARIGKTFFQITRRHVFLPNDRVEVVSIEPTEIEFRFKQEK